MCSKRDIDTVLAQFELCHDRDEKRYLLEKLDVCGNCPEKPSVSSKENSHCHCEGNKHIEMLNFIEHIRQSCTPKKSWAKE